MRKKIVFVGNRYSGLKALLNNSKLELVRIFYESGSYLEKELLTDDLNNSLPLQELPKEKERLLTELSNIRYDILISNGCRFKLPVSVLQDGSKLFLNIHPSLLPRLKGKNPLNGIFLFGHKEFGVTLHYMDDGIDTGNIILQKKIQVTSDLDLGMLYLALLDLEYEVLKEGLDFLDKCHFIFKGHPHSRGSYYSRKQEDMTVFFNKERSADIVRKTKAFGVLTQGVTCEIKGEQVKIFDAENITNSYFLNRYGNYKPGEVVTEYDNKLIIRTNDGLVKITRWAKN